VRTRSRQSSCPSDRSTFATCGRSARASSSARAAQSASPHTRMSPSSSTRCRSPSRNTGWSSTTRIRSRSALVRSPPRGRASPGSMLRFLRADGPPHVSPEPKRCRFPVPGSWTVVASWCRRCRRPGLPVGGSPTHAAGCARLSPRRKASTLHPRESVGTRSAAIGLDETAGAGEGR
jgi:hypothetical protein